MLNRHSAHLQALLHKVRSVFSNRVKLSNVVDPSSNIKPSFSPFTSFISEGQVYVYYRGQLLLKKWLWYPPGQSQVFSKPGNL